MPTTKYFPTKEELYNLYIEQRLSIKEIAKIYNTTSNAVEHWIQRNNIYKKQIEKIDEIELINLFKIQNKSVKEIAQLLDIAENKVRYYLSKYNLINTDFCGFTTKCISHTEEQLYDLYITQNKTIDELSKILGKSRAQTRRYLRYYNIKKPKEKWKSAEQRTIQNRFGCSTSALPEVQKKVQETTLKRYGVKNYSQTDECKEKIKKNNLAKYGVESTSGLPEVLEKARQTNLKRRGYEYSMQDPKVRAKSAKTCMEKYGVPNIQSLPEIKEKIKRTNIKKYGVPNPMILPEFQEKMKRTLDKNGTWSVSKPEMQIKYLLLALYPNTKHQYRNKEEYPFNCDFYIPEIDTYIEYQGHISHGKTIYDPNNQEHIAIINKWKKRAIEIEEITSKRSRYTDYIDTWTKRDPLKRETAKKNNLNWIEFFNMEQFFAWYKTQKGLPLLEYKSSIK